MEPSVVFNSPGSTVHDTYIWSPEDLFWSLFLPIGIQSKCLFVELGSKSEFNLASIFHYAPFNTAVQESRDPSSEVKFTQDTAVQYLHKITVELQQQTIDTSTPPHPHLHLPANTLMLSSSCWADGFPSLWSIIPFVLLHTSYSSRKISPLSTPPPFPLPPCSLFWFCCVPVLIIFFWGEEEEEENTTHTTSIFLHADIQEPTQGDLDLP